MLGTLGVDLVATLVAPGVLPAADMGARIEVPITRAIVSYYRLAAYDPITGLWTVVIEPPPSAGEFNLVWRTNDAEPPEMEVFIPLSVLAASLVATLPAPGTRPEWAPSVERVAGVLAAYARGGFDDDREDAGAIQTDGGVPTFTDDTEPTRTHVEGLIQAACDEVQGRVAVAIPPARYGLAQTAAKWHVAAMVSAGKQPGGTDEDGGAYRGFIANFRASLDELILLCRMGPSRLR